MKILALAIFLLFWQSDDGRGTDGHYHDPYTGAVQPEHCDNGFKNEHPCNCERATDDCSNKDGVSAAPGKKCSTYCRANDCHCHGSCS